MGALLTMIAFVVISWLLSGIPELNDPELIARLEQGDIDAVLGLDPEVVRRTLFALVAGGLASGVIGFFAIPLVWFRKMSLLAAATNGLKALFRNFLAFVLLLVGVMALCIPMFIVLGTIVGFTVIAGGLGILQYALFLLVVLGVQLLVYGTQYCAYAEIFALDADQSPGPSIGPDDVGEDQFVA